METSEKLDFLLSKENIENALNSLNGEIDSQLIKITFASLFKDTNYEVYSIIHGNNEGLLTESTEWLFDLIVTQEMKSEINGLQDYLIDTILVLESEISTGFNGVMYDFQKLLISNSKYKVIVFRCHSSDLKSFFEYMKKNIKNYSTSNGKFFLIGYLNDCRTYSISEENAN